MSEKDYSSDLPVPLTSGGLAGPGRYHNPSRPPESAFGEPSALLSHYVWIVARHRWKILCFIAFCVLTTFVVSRRLTPIYESTAVIDIDRQVPEGIMGQEAMRAAPSDSDEFLATQIRLIQSDEVLRPIAVRYNLREHEHQLRKDTKRQGRGPVVLHNLTVTRYPNTYLLTIGYRSPDPVLAANVANGVANSFIENSYAIRFRASMVLSSFMEKQMEAMRAKMEKSSAALAVLEKELNVINPEEKTNMLSARLLQLNTEYTTAQGERVKKEAAFESVRNGADQAAQVSTQGDSLRRITERLNESQEKFADAKVRFGTNHPEYKKAAAQVAELQRQLDESRKDIHQRVKLEYDQSVRRERMLQQAVADTKAEFDRLNARSFEYRARKGEAETDKKFYEELIHKIKEAGVNSTLQNNSIRLANSALPSETPISPRVRFNVLLAFLFSTCFAVGAAFLTDLFDRKIRDQEQVRRSLNARPLGCLPVVRFKDSVALPLIEGDGSLDEASNGKVGLLRRKNVDFRVYGYLEAVRTLRNSILLSDLNRHLFSILVTSAMPKEGKTTTSVHLAVANAQQRKRTLLIDCDLRRPNIHRYFNIPNDTGVTSILTKNLPWREAVRELGDRGNLSVIPSGPPSRQAAELVGSGLSAILEEASGEYDLIIIDAPPMLGFAEPLQMATVVDGVLVVTLAGGTDRQAVSSVLGMLHSLRAHVVGVVLNGVNQEKSEGYYYSGYYRKGYGEYYKTPPSSTS